MKKNKSGFTLIELSVVIIILGMFATVSIVALNTTRSKSRDTKRLSDIQKIVVALEMYNRIEGTYPSTNDSTYCSNESSWADDLGDKLRPYLGELSLDPKHPDSFYRYCYTTKYSATTEKDQVEIYLTLENSRPHEFSVFSLLSYYSSSGSSGYRHYSILQHY